MNFVKTAAEQFGKKVPLLMIGQFTAVTLYYISQGNDPVEAVKKALKKLVL